jgi:uncharacterized membrane protein YphA (DoxX/SURF4 family)
MATTTHPDDELWTADAVALEPAAAPASPLARLWRFLTGPYPTLISRLALGGIFFLAGLTKLGVPATFVESINAYEMPLPAALVQAMAVGLPPLEIGLGVWLLAGLFTRFAAGISGSLMVVFLIAMIQAVMRGLEFNCGCVAGPAAAAGSGVNPLGLALVQALGPIGKFLTEETVGLGSIARDVVFLLMAVHLVLVPTVFSVDSWRRRRNAAETVEESEDAIPADAVATE